MSDLQAFLIKHATNFRLQEHGLTVKVSRVDDAPDPLLAGIGTTYGPHEDMTAEHFMMSKIDSVKDYCINTLNCTEKDIIWRPIEINYAEFENGLMVEEDYNVEGGWHDDVIGFIYIKKDEALKLCNESEMSAEVDALIEAQFNVQLASYDKWGVKDTYQVEVVKDGLQTQFIATNLYDIDGWVDRATNELIDDFVSYIDNQPNTVKVVLDYYDDYLFTGENLPVYFNKLMDKHYGFTPAIGTINVNDTIGKADSRVSFNLSMDCVPPFLILAAASTSNLIAGMKKHWCNFDAVELGENKPYSEWSDTMIEALIQSLLDFTNGIVIQNIRKLR